MLGAKEVELAEAEDVVKITNAKVGFAGPIGLNIPVIMDNGVKYMRNFIVGANETDHHYKNVNLEDFEVYKIADIRNVKEHDRCPNCDGHLVFKKGIEIGNTFKLGTKYSESLGLNYSDENNELKPVVMGCYGIGIERIIAALVEQNHDEKGIIWPMNIAPFKVCIVQISDKDEKQKEVANNLYNTLNSMGIDTLLDDRNERPGVKFNDMDLIGIPVRITVGKKVEENNVELLHVDVMDGHFVEKMAFGPDHIKMLKELTTIPLDVHLMIEKPERKLDTIIDAGADIITIHQESTTRLYSCIEKIKSRGVKAGVVLSPATNEDTLKYVLDKIDMILLMTINPGEAGPGFHEELLTKIKNVRELIGDRDIDLEVDGGIDNTNIAKCKEAGVNVFVSGGYVFKGDIAEKIKTLREALK